MKPRRVWTYALVAIVIGGLCPTTGWCDKITGLERERAQSILREIASDVKKHYYDPKFHGLDWDSKVREMKEKIDKADTSNMALSEVAALLDLLNDSHTFFLPPRHYYHHDYGWKAQLIGDRCFVLRVRPGSDAESKGLKPGDEVLAINGFDTTKDNFRKMEYVFDTLRPQSSLRLDLRDPAGKERTTDTITKFKEMKRVTDLTGRNGGDDIWDYIRELENEQHLARARWVETGDELMILKFPAFFSTSLKLSR